MFQLPRGREFWSWPPTIAVLLVMVVFLGASTARVLRRKLELRKEREALERKIQESRAERAALEERIRELRTPAGVERLAKEKLGLKLEGEEVVIVIPEEQATTVESTSERFWVRIWRFILQLFSRGG